MARFNKRFEVKRKMSEGGKIRQDDAKNNIHNIDTNLLEELGKVVRDKLNQDEIKDVRKYYMYQGGRHPAVPTGTKLVFLQIIGVY